MLDSIRNNPAFRASLARLDIVPGAGDYPLTYQGVLIGAIGCGGGIGEEDEQCAEAGARAVHTESRLHMMRSVLGSAWADGGHAHSMAAVSISRGGSGRASPCWWRH